MNITVNAPAQAPLLDTAPLRPARARRSTWARLGACAQGLALLAAIAVVILAVLPVALGLRGEVVLSGSMRPMLQVGDVTYFNPAHASQLHVGEVVTFPVPGLGRGVLVTHRIIAIAGQGSAATLTTKGDNNPAPDSFTTSATTVLGTYAFKAPHLGSVLIHLRDRTTYVIVASLLFLLVLIHEGRTVVSEARTWRRRRHQLRHA